MDNFFFRKNWKACQNTTTTNACLDQAYAAVAADSVVKMLESLGLPLPFGT